MTLADRFRVLLRERLRRVHYRRVRSLSQAELEDSAVIFSPHQDDETLACGGTILKKVGAGAHISIVFMTDGRSSHAGLIPEDDIARMRKEEAIAAAGSLGVGRDSLHFLDFEDTRLGEYCEAAVQAVVVILEHLRPDSVFVPCEEDPPPDHLATRKIVLSALKSTGQKPVIYEYPVWFWQHWPWTPVPYRRRREIPSAFLNSIRSVIKLLGNFTWGVNIEDVHMRKRAALEQHRSQMTKVDKFPHKRTLNDVSDGEFLACFFEEFELFNRRGK